MKSTTKKWNVHENFAFGAQHNLYFTDSRWGFALGVMQILKFTLGVTQILTFLDTNMLVFQARNVFASQWNIGLNSYFLC